MAERSGAYENKLLPGIHVKCTFKTDTLFLHVFGNITKHFCQTHFFRFTNLSYFDGDLVD